MKKTHYIPGNAYQLYVRVLDGGDWLGTYAPVNGRLEWLRPDGQLGLFTLTDNDLTNEDEYEYFRPGTHLLAELVEVGDFRAMVGFFQQPSH